MKDNTPTNTDSVSNRRSFIKNAALTVGALAASSALPIGAATHRIVSPPQPQNPDWLNHGSLRFDFAPGFGPVMGDQVPDFAWNCTAFAEVEWNKLHDFVEIHVHYENLPHRPRVERVPGTNPQTPWTPAYPEVVENAAYQIWLIPIHPFGSGAFYYDPQTLDLVGNFRTMPNPSPNLLINTAPVVRLVSSPLFEPNKNGVADLRWRFNYNQVLDEFGGGGSDWAAGPLNLRRVGNVDAITTYKLPASEALSFDFFLNGAGFVLDTTVEPHPKPIDLRQTYNPIVVCGNGAYQQIPYGLRVDTLVTNRVLAYSPSEIGQTFVRPLIPGTLI